MIPARPFYLALLFCAFSILGFAITGLAGMDHLNAAKHKPHPVVTEPPAWAYLVAPPDAKSTPDDGALLRVPGSSAGFTLSQVDDAFLSPDWHPDDHPQMPEVVLHGRKPDVFACGYCHRAEGTGGPENAGIAGLPYIYIVQQLKDYRNGSRSTARPSRAPQKFMIASTKAATDEELEQAAKYFSSLTPKANLRVVETDTIPKVYVGHWIFARATGNETEPLGQRIVEMPENPEQFELRDSRSRFIAYVPKGSLRKGQDIVSGLVRQEKQPCSTCHGKNLKGLLGVPAIAGRSPTYVLRQLYELQAGLRHGKYARDMKEPVERLTLDDMIAVAAYLASLQP